MPTAAITGFPHVAPKVRVRSAGAMQRVVDFVEPDGIQPSALWDEGS